jgi:hypothetical protein
MWRSDFFGPPFTLHAVPMSPQGVERPGSGSSMGHAARRSRDPSAAAGDDRVRLCVRTSKWSTNFMGFDPSLVKGTLFSAVANTEGFTSAED